MDNDLVSVIMPSYNTEDYIKYSIMSVINQTYKNWELIIIDDCSNDDTDKVVSLFCDERVVYYKNKSNKGAAYSRNKGLRLAKGKWIAFLDSDDLWESDKLKRQIEFMKKNRVYFSYTNYSEINENGDATGIVVSGPSIISRLGMNNYCWPGCLTVMYDAEKIGLVQIEEIKKNNDYAMWLQICKKADCYLLNETLAHYRRGRQGSISSHGILAMIKWHYFLFRKAEQCGIILSSLKTTVNLVFGLYKKIKYVNKC